MIHIVCSVCYPILTGPSFASYNRAIYLKKYGYDVILYYPYLTKEEERNKYYNTNKKINSEDELRNVIYDEFKIKIPIIFYPAHNFVGYQSFFIGSVGLAS